MMLRQRVTMVTRKDVDFFLLVIEVKVHTANTSFFRCSLPHMKQQEMTTGARASI